MANLTDTVLEGMYFPGSLPLFIVKIFAFAASKSESPKIPFPATSIYFISSRVRGLPESEEDQRPGARSRLRKRLLRENLEEEAKELRSAFQHRNLEAILRATRSTLEILKKRVQVSSLHMYEVTPAQVTHLSY